MEGKGLLLKSLSEQYARQAREFADAGALLGRHNSVGLDVLKLFKKIKRESELCRDAEEKLERYIKQKIEDPESGSLMISGRSKPFGKRAGGALGQDPSRAIRPKVQFH